MKNLYSNTLNIPIQNLKCGGCAHTIKEKLSALDQVAAVEVHIDENSIAIHSDHTLNADLIKNELSNLGYPPLDEANSFGKKAKSMVSCAVGRIKQ